MRISALIASTIGLPGNPSITNRANHSRSLLHFSTFDEERLEWSYDVSLRFLFPSTHSRCMHPTTVDS
jgi:hypothetical protein